MNKVGNLVFEFVIFSKFFKFECLSVFLSVFSKLKKAEDKEGFDFKSQKTVKVSKPKNAFSLTKLHNQNSCSIQFHPRTNFFPVFVIRHSMRITSIHRKSNRSYIATKMFEKCIRFDENFVPAYLGLSKIQSGISSGVLLKKALKMNAESFIVRLEYADWLYAKCMNIQFRKVATELDFLSFQIYTSKH